MFVRQPQRPADESAAPATARSGGSRSGGSEVQPPKEAAAAAAQQKASGVTPKHLATSKRRLPRLQHDGPFESAGIVAPAD